MNERAVKWYRVSSDKQDEQNQVRCVDRHFTGHGYIEARPPFVLHAKSASKGEQEPELAQVLADIEAGEYTVVVVAQSSRLDRRDDLDAQLAFAIAVRRAGGRVESVDEPSFGKGDLPGWLTTLVAMESNAKLSRDLKANVRRGLDRVHANGAVDNRVPWGFRIEGPKYNRRMIPTAQAREYVPQIFARVIAGQSLAQVCRWLEAQGVKPAGIAKADSTRGKSGLWHPRVLGALVRNPVYAGTRVDGNGQTTCEWATEDEPALVSWATRADAVQALESRPKRGPVLKENRCELSGATRCLSCGGPLYRITGGAAGRCRIQYLRCAGTGARRQSCGAPMIRLETAQALAEQVLGGLHVQVMEYREVPGNQAGVDAELARLDYERRQVALRGLSWADEDAERARIRAEYEAVAATEIIPARRMAKPTGETYGSRWSKQDADARADWLRSGEVTVAFTRLETEQATATLDGVSLVLVWNEDQDEAA